MTQTERILGHLRTFGTDSDSNIARALSIPQPSVRRAIQQLIAAGYNISHQGRQGYTLVVPSSDVTGA